MDSSTRKHAFVHKILGRFDALVVQWRQSELVILYEYSRIQYQIPYDTELCIGEKNRVQVLRNFIRFLSNICSYIHRGASQYHESFSTQLQYECEWTMKFCKNLQRVVDISDPEWAPYWTNYKMLKVCSFSIRRWQIVPPSFYADSLPKE